LPTSAGADADRTCAEPQFLEGETMPQQLVSLPYAPDALEPHIDRQTMEIHHGKHHKAYVDNFNAAIAKQPELEGKPLADVLANDCAIVKEEIRMAVRNNGGGIVNHNQFWEILAPAGKGGGKPVGNLAKAIDQAFGGFDAFKEKFETAGKTRFGSGWAWLIKKGGKLEVISTANQDSPLMQGAAVVIGLDVWEHAYYLKYQNRRPDYIAAWWNLVNWQAAESRFNQAK
jgi:Fe-Mn family superoxide dismutase